MLDHTDLLPTVCDDLLFINKDFHNVIDEAALRRASTAIRRLIDGDLQRAWKAAGFQKELVLRATDLDVNLIGLKKELVTYASAGGADIGGTYIAPVTLVSYAIPGDVLFERYKRGIPWQDYKLSDFGKSSSLVTNGLAITRRQIVRYVANKLGGAHHDPKRGTSDEDASFAALDLITKGRPIQVADKSPVYFELLAIGQAIGKSEDLRQLVERIQASRNRR